MVKNPEGDSTTFGIDSTNGNRIWQQDARGITLRTTITYDPVTNQPATVTAPTSLPQSFEYNALGNLAEHFDEADQRRSWFGNSIGLDTLARVPYSTLKPRSGPYEITRFMYSARNELLVKGHGAGAISDTVRTTYH